MAHYDCQYCGHSFYDYNLEPHTAKCPNCGLSVESKTLKEVKHGN